MFYGAIIRFLFLNNRPFSVVQDQSKPSGPMHFLKITCRVRTNADSMVQHLSISLLTEQAPSPNLW